MKQAPIRSRVLRQSVRPERFPKLRQTVPVDGAEYTNQNVVTRGGAVDVLSTAASH